MTIHHPVQPQPHHQPHHLGHQVVDPHDNVVGTVSDVLYDDTTSEPRWLVVDPGVLRAERYVPIEGSYTAENGHIVIPYDKKWVKDAPHAAHDHVMTTPEERALDRHYETASRPHDGLHDRPSSATTTGTRPATTARRFLVLVDAPLRAETARARLAEFAVPGARFHVVVPARELSDDEREFVLHERGGASEAETPEVVAARWRLQAATDALVEAGFHDVTGHVGAPSPVEAVDEAFIEGEHDTVIVVTKPLGLKGWVHLDLPSRVARHVDEPVVHVEV